MTNIEKLKQLGILGDIRQRLGAETADDKSKDKRINQMSNNDLLKAWSGWNLGDPNWWTVMKAYYDGLERISK